MTLRGRNKTGVGRGGSGAGRNKWRECCKFVFEFGYGDEEEGSSDSYLFFFNWRDFNMFIGISEKELGERKKVNMKRKKG